MNGYKIITKNTTNEKLVIYPIPKNAITSIKMFLAQHLNLHDKFEYREDIPRYKRKLEKYYPVPSICGFLPNYTKFEKVNADIRICVIRDPIERFISTYQNRILFHRDIRFNGLTVNDVYKFSFYYDPNCSINISNYINFYRWERVASDYLNIYRKLGYTND